MFTMRRAGLLLASGGLIAAIHGPGLTRAPADPANDRLVELSNRFAQQTCQYLTAFPNVQGVNRAIADVLDQNDMPRSDAGQVVALGVKNSCPQYLPLVQQVVPNFH